MFAKKDCFYEQGVMRRSKGLYEAAYYLSMVIAVVLIGFALIELTGELSGGFSLWGVIVSVLCIAVGVFMLLFRGRLRAELDYTFTNGELDISAIYNGMKRRELGSVDVREAAAFGKVTGSSFQRYLSMPQIVQKRWFLNREAELYYIYVQKNSERLLYVLEPDSELLAGIRDYLPAGALQE